MKQKSISGIPTFVNTGNIIKSISYEQDEIITDILQLYCHYDFFDVDLTYSTGNFYKNIIDPKLKFDINPQVSDVIQSDYTNIPLKDNSVSSLMFDPPFLATQPKEYPQGAMICRFGYFKNVEELWESYYKAIKEVYRVLKEDGVFVFKCQDTILSAKQYLTHVEIINCCIDAGFYPKDLFVLLAKNRLVRTGQKNQYHARKFHSYFLVFIKTKCKVRYFNYE